MEMTIRCQLTTVSGLSWTRNDSFDKYGYLVINNLWDLRRTLSSCSRKKGTVFLLVKVLLQLRHPIMDSNVSGIHQYRAITWP